MIAEKDVRAFESSHLGEGETVQLSAQGFTGRMMGNGSEKQVNGALILTEKRVVFFSKGLFRETMTSLDRAAVTSSELSKSFIHEIMTIRAGHSAIRFTSRQSERLRLFRECLVNLMGSDPSPEAILSATARDNQTELRMGCAVVAAIVVVVALVLSTGNSSMPAKSEPATTAAPVESKPRTSEKRQQVPDCILGIPGQMGSVPGYRTMAKFDESYELSRAGATESRDDAPLGWRWREDDPLGNRLPVHGCRHYDFYCHGHGGQFQDAEVHRPNELDPIPRG